jgi:hypothetical protein
VTVPEGREVRIAQPQPAQDIWKMESGIWFIDFGSETLDDPQFFERARAFLTGEPASKVVWVIQGSAVANFPMGPEPLQRWLRRLHCLLRLYAPGDEERHHFFAVEVESEAQRAFAYLLLALGVPLNQTGPNGELLIEVDGPQGVTVGIPGPSCEALAPEQCFVRQANNEKDRLAVSGGAELAEVERLEREAIARVLEAPPELHWRWDSSKAVA